METTISIDDLPEEHARLVCEFVAFLKAKSKLHPVPDKLDNANKPEFAEWPLEVRGRVTREEIYDHL